MRKTMVSAAELAFVLSLVAGCGEAPPAKAPPAKLPPPDCPAQYELAVRLDPNGNVPNPGDADGKVGCPFILKVNNLSKEETRLVSMKLERNTPGGPKQEFDLCVGPQLRDPHEATPGLSQKICDVRPNLFAGLGNTTHPRDNDDSQGPLERGFKYTLYIDGQPKVDPDLVIRR